MKCPKCGNEYEIFDFFGRDKCYRCIYLEKVSNLKKTKKIPKCKICEKTIPHNRWTFCSDECLSKDRREPWYIKINIYKIPWKNYSKWSG